MPTFDDFLDTLSSNASLSGAEQVLINTAGGSRIADVGDLVLRYSGWIDPHRLGAKGDAVAYADGITTTGSDVYESVSHEFTAEDVGKAFYSDAYSAGRRTVVEAAVGGNTHRIRVSGGVAGANATGRYWIMGTDDTVPLRNAIALAGRNRGGGIAGGTAAGSPNRNYGGCIYLRPNSRYLVRNTSAEYAAGAGVLGALRLPPRVGIVSMGGPRNCQIMAAPDHYGHIITTSVENTFHDFLTLSGFSVHGNGGMNSVNGLDAIHLDLAFDGYAEVDAFFNVFNVDTYDASRDGLYLNGRGEGIVSNHRSIRARRKGIFLDGTMDSTFVSMNAGGSRMTGIHANATSSSRLIGCKAFYNGAGGGAVSGDCANWWISADDPRNATSVFSACEAQESRGSGWLIEGGASIFSACMSGDPGRYALANTGTRPAVRAGFELQGVNCQHNIFSDCAVQPSVGSWAGQRDVVESEVTQPTRTSRNWGWGTDSVHVGADPQQNRGRIFTHPYTDYDTGSGARGGAGTTNGRNPLMQVDGVSLT